jgi:hypothetical protein
MLLEASLHPENCVPVKPWKLENDDTNCLILFHFLNVIIGILGPFHSIILFLFFNLLTLFNLYPPCSKVYTQLVLFIYLFSFLVIPSLASSSLQFIPCTFLTLPPPPLQHPAMFQNPDRRIKV